MIKLLITIPAKDMTATLQALLLAQGATIETARFNRQLAIRTAIKAAKDGVNASRLARELTKLHGVPFRTQNVYKELKALGLKSKRVNKLPKKQKQPK